MPHASHHPPRNADCRGGVFAKRRFPRPAPLHAYTRLPACLTYGDLWPLSRCVAPRWLGRALATLGIAPTKNAVANLATIPRFRGIFIPNRVIFAQEPHLPLRSEQMRVGAPCYVWSAHIRGSGYCPLPRQIHGEGMGWGAVAHRVGFSFASWGGCSSCCAGFRWLLSSTLWR